MPDLNNETALRPNSDSPTAFLESPRRDRITEETKRLVAQTYAKNGNMTLTCQTLGVDPRSIRIHYNQDQAFKRLIDEAREQISDKAEGHIVEHMGNRANVIDRLAWLRAWRPSVWNPDKRIQVEVSVQQVTQSIDKATVLDGELVQRLAEELPSGVDGKPPPPALDNDMAPPPNAANKKPHD